MQFWDQAAAGISSGGRSGCYMFAALVIAKLRVVCLVTRTYRQGVAAVFVSGRDVHRFVAICHSNWSANVVRITSWTCTLRTQLDYPFHRSWSTLLYNVAALGKFLRKLLGCRWTSAVSRSFQEEKSNQRRCRYLCRQLVVRAHLGIYWQSQSRSYAWCWCCSTWSQRRLSGFQCLLNLKAVQKLFSSKHFRRGERILGNGHRSHAYSSGLVDCPCTC